MSKIRFIKSKNENVVTFKQISSTVIDLVFEKDVHTTELVGGFEVLNEYNNTVMGLYDTYTTVYRSYEDEPLHFQLSNDGSVYEEPSDPEPEKVVITFVGTEHLSLSFESVEVDEGTDLSEIEFPEVASDDAEYTLSGWSRSTGEVNGDTTIFARESYEHIMTLEETRSAKIAELASTCEQLITAGVDVEIDGETEHFSYTVEDQANIDDLLSMLSATGMDQPYHADGKICKLYTPEQIIAIYVAEKVNKTHHITYNNSLKAYVQTLETKEAIEAVTYGQDLEGEYLENYNAMMAQAQAITEAVLASMNIGSTKTESDTTE